MCHDVPGGGDFVCMSMVCPFYLIGVSTTVTCVLAVLLMLEIRQELLPRGLKSPEEPRTDCVLLLVVSSLSAHKTSV